MRIEPTSSYFNDAVSRCCHHQFSSESSPGRFGGLLEVEAQALVCVGQALGQLGFDARPLVAGFGLELDLDGDLVAALAAAENDLELLDLAVLADDGLDGARIDVGAADDLHVVRAAEDAALVDVAGAPAAAGAHSNPFRIDIELLKPETRTPSNVALTS